MKEEIKKTIVEFSQHCKYNGKTQSFQNFIYWLNDQPYLMQNESDIY
jgi:hypothetical protein